MKCFVTKCSTLLMLTFMLFVGGCDSNEEGGFDMSDYRQVELLPLSDKILNFLYVEPWVTWETYKNQKGVIQKATLSADYVSWRVRLSEDRSIGGPVNIPEEYLIEGVEIIFSGESRDHPLIDMDALPLILTDLKVKKSNITIK